MSNQVPPPGDSVPTSSRVTQAHIRSDLKRNAGDIRIQLALVLFRLAKHCRTESGGARYLGKPLSALYLVVVEWLFGIELPWATSVGSGLRIFHGTGLVVSAYATLGDEVTLHQGVTIGARTEGGDCPTLQDRVTIFAGATVLGAITLGHDSRVAAGAVLLSDLPPGALAVGNPARIIPASRRPDVSND